MNDWSQKKYQQLDRKQLQLFCSEFPYKSDNQLFDSTLGNSFESKKFFDSREQIMEFKEEAAQNDVALQKKRDFVTGSKTTTNSQTISIIDSIIGEGGEDEYRSAIQLADFEPDPLNMTKALFAIQAGRLRRGIEYEKDVGMGLSQETEAAMSNAITLTKLTNEIINGKKLDVQLEGSLSSMIMGMDLGEDFSFDDEEEYIDIELEEEEDAGRRDESV